MEAVKSPTAILEPWQFGKFLKSRRTLRLGDKSAVSTACDGVREKKKLKIHKNYGDIALTRTTRRKSYLIARLAAKNMRGGPPHQKYTHNNEIV